MRVSCRRESINSNTYVRISMATIKRSIKKSWNRLLDASETLDHLESVVSVKVLRPIREVIAARRANHEVEHYAF